MLSSIKEYKLDNLSSNSISLEVDNSVVLICPDNSNVTIDMKDFSSVNNVEIKGGQNSNILVRFLFTCKDIELNIKSDVSRGTFLHIVLADFSNGNTKVNSNISLLEEKAHSTFNLAVLSSQEQTKVFNISFDHHVSKTYSEIDAYGVSKDNSLIKILGTSHIENKADKSEASQKVKVILFDEKSRAIANPILKIDNNDIKANHACAIGSLKEEHLYYLLSRGIELKEARGLITLGYLMPISSYFDKDDSEFIKNLIGGSF